MVVPGAIVGCENNNANRVYRGVTGSSEEVRPAFAQPSAFTMILRQVIALALVSQDRSPDRLNKPLPLTSPHD